MGLGHDLITSAFGRKTPQAEGGQGGKRRPSITRKCGTSILGQFGFPRNHVVIFMECHALNFELGVLGIEFLFFLPTKVFSLMFL